MEFSEVTLFKYIIERADRNKIAILFQIVNNKRRSLQKSFAIQTCRVVAVKRIFPEHVHLPLAGDQCARAAVASRVNDVLPFEADHLLRLNCLDCGTASFRWTTYNSLLNIWGWKVIGSWIYLLEIIWISTAVELTTLCKMWNSSCYLGVKKLEPGYLHCSYEIYLRNNIKTLTFPADISRAVRAGIAYTPANEAVQHGSTRKEHEVRK